MTSARNSFWRTTRMTGIIVREIVGWILLVYGLNVFWICFQYLERALVVEGIVAAVVGTILFRGGLQLVKVSVAARALRNSSPASAGVIE